MHVPADPTVYSPSNLLQYVLKNVVQCKSVTVCDMAGAESLRHTNNSLTLIESSEKKLSLFGLRNCFSTIRSNESNRVPKEIPFRNSKLAHLLKGALTGRQSLTTIININPTPELQREMIDVLRFSPITEENITDIQEEHRAQGQAENIPERSSPHMPRTEQPSSTPGSPTQSRTRQLRTAHARGA
jgi:hypothetical protein